MFPFLFRGGGGHFRKTNLSLSLFYEALALSRAETKEGPLSLSLSLEKETLEKKERKKERKKEDEEEEMRKQNQCAAQSLYFPPSKTTRRPIDLFGN